MTRPSAKALRLLACVLSLSLAEGCRDACLSLADRICSCQPDDASKANCNAQAKLEESIFAVTKADQSLCQAKLDANQCTCEVLNTPEGRASCGLTLTPPP
jgi:hypothetical protein